VDDQASHDVEPLQEEARTWAYPMFVITPDEHRRWRLCRSVAESFADEDSDTIWFASRSLYRSDIPTE